MGTLHVRDIGDDTMHTLKVRAAKSGKSLQAYVRCVLEEEAGTLTIEEAADEARAIAERSSVTNDDVLASIVEMRQARE